MSATTSPETTTSRPLAAAAVETEFFERTRLFHGRSKISLAEVISREAGGLTFNALGLTTTVRNYTLKDVILDADSLILFQNGHAIPETAYFESPDAIRLLPEQIELTPLPENEDFILGYNNVHWGYQHWLTQCLPAIDWSLGRKRSRDVRLILPRLHPWQEDMLALLGYDRVPRLTPEANIRYRLPHVEYSDFLNGTTSFAICLSALETAQRIAKAVTPFRSDDKVLYIDEVTPHYGSIRNEGAVIDFMRRRGVTIVERGRLPAAERINLFRNADVVIGPLGEGLSDVLFCRPGTLLWEWMPRHYQNASINRLAQAAQLDYWGDMFEIVAEPAKPGQWEVDLGLVETRLKELSTRLSHQAAAATLAADVSTNVTSSVSSLPFDELMLSFESLGDNCEFGLVQRYAGVEPLGLLRFNGFFSPPEFRLHLLVEALERKFDGLGAPGSISVFAEGLPGERELMVRESAYQFWYHSGVREGEVDPDVQAKREATRLSFLRRKLLDDLATGDKIWVWKSQATTHRDQIRPLLEILRRLGPNTLLWVVEADDEHAVGTIESLEPDFIKGYISRFAPYDNVLDIQVAPWFAVCWRVDELLHPDRPAVEPEVAYEPPPRPLSAMEILASNSSATPRAASVVKPKPVTRSRLWGWLRRR
jgi:capsular polysaccharide biosynthesis protein